MEYDNYGNITKKNGTEYIYGKYYPDDNFSQEPTELLWKDLLTYYDGARIDYDDQGNPTSYLGHTLTWEKGRQLKKFDNIEYTYNANGIRTSKKVNGVLHTYTIDGAKILRETWGENTLVPLYDNEDNICGILYNSVPYYFTKNLQGDIIAIVDKNAQTVARYSYDAWGVPEVKFDSSDCQIATINPFRYRGYYYDEEIGLYYLQSRYYNASISRFLNTDDAKILTTVFDENNSLNYNLTIYCINSPINNADSNGKWLARLVCGITSGALFATLAYVVCKVVNIFTPVSKKVTAAITGACSVLGGIIGATLGVSFLAKHAPKLLQAIKKIEKTRFSLKAIGPNTGGNIFGIVISNTLIIMLHAPHPKYNEWYFHIQVEVKIGKKQIPIWKRPIVYVNPRTWGK